MPTAAALGAGSVFGAASSASAAKSAAKAQTAAAQIAAQVQESQYNQTRTDLGPYRDIGAGAGATLSNRLTELTSPITMDQATLEQTPGYQFNLSQGLKAAQSAAAARGLGLSGAAIKAATGYATGLADSTYQNQFNNANTNQTNAFNRLLATTGIGASAAGATSQAGQTMAAGVGNAAMSAGNAQAGAATATGNALSSGANNLAQYYAFAPLYNKLGSGDYFGKQS